MERKWQKVHRNVTEAVKVNARIVVAVAVKQQSLKGKDGTAKLQPNIASV